MLLPVGHIRLSSILLDAGVVTREQVDAALARQLTTGLKIGETLVELGAATEEDIGWALARQLQLPFVDLQPATLDRQLLQAFPPELLLRLDAVPLVRDDAGLSVAVADPLDPELVRDLELAARRPVRLAVATPSAIRRILVDLLGPARETRARTIAFDFGSGDGSGAGFLELHLGKARRAGATEIHFLPRPGSLDVFHRVGTRLVSASTEPLSALDILLSHLEDLGLPVFGDRGLQAGRARVNGATLGVETQAMDVSVLHGESGRCVTVELVDMPVSPPVLEDLGIEAVELASLRGLLEEPAGLGIVTGPPRSGGSTTLGCLAREAATFERRAIVGAPGQPAGGTGPDWLAAAAAQSADLVALDGLANGEAMRAMLAPEGAGRLLLVRTDWTDTFALLEHLASQPRERVALAERLRFVIQQRLLRGGFESGAEPRRPWGDRRVIFEVTLPGDRLRAAIRAGETAEGLRGAAVQDGFHSLAQRFQAWVDSGLASSHDAARIQA